MALRFKCPNCGRARTLSHNEIGEAVLCFACGTRFLFEQAVNIEVTYKTIELPPGATGEPDGRRATSLAAD
jgi:DNA-directed RNA polymerase subunit RPC12/RpoP